MKLGRKVKKLGTADLRRKNIIFRKVKEIVNEIFKIHEKKKNN